MVPSIDDEEESNELQQLEEAALIASELAIEDAEPLPTHPAIVFLLKAIKVILLPFCKILFAPAAQRTFVKTTIMSLTISCIVATSAVAYIIFYNKYIPPITHVQPVWFHYGLQNTGPAATVDVLAGNSQVKIVIFFVYDIFLLINFFLRL